MAQGMELPIDPCNDIAPVAPVTAVRAPFGDKPLSP